MTQQQAAQLLAYIRRSVAVGVHTTLAEAEQLQPALLMIHGIANGSLQCAVSETAAQADAAGPGAAVRD